MWVMGVAMFMDQSRMEEGMSLRRVEADRLDRMRSLLIMMGEDSTSRSAAADGDIAVIAIAGQAGGAHGGHHGLHRQFRGIHLQKIDRGLEIDCRQRLGIMGDAFIAVQRGGDQGAQRAQLGQRLGEMRQARRQVAAARCALRMNFLARSTAPAAMPAQVADHIRCAVGTMLWLWMTP